MVTYIRPLESPQRDIKIEDRPHPANKLPSTHAADLPNGARSATSPALTTTHCRTAQTCPYPVGIGAQLPLRPLGARRCSLDDGICGSRGPLSSHDQTRMRARRKLVEGVNTRQRARIGDGDPASVGSTGSHRQGTRSRIGHGAPTHVGDGHDEDEAAVEPLVTVPEMYEVPAQKGSSPGQPLSCRTHGPQNGLPQVSAQADYGSGVPLEIGMRKSSPLSFMRFEQTTQERTYLDLHY